MTGLTPLSAAGAGRWSARNPWWALCLWLTAVAVALGAGSVIRTHGPVGPAPKAGPAWSFVLSARPLDTSAGGPVVAVAVAGLLGGPGAPGGPSLHREPAAGGERAPVLDGAPAVRPQARRVAALRAAVGAVRRADPAVVVRLAGAVAGRGPAGGLPGQAVPAAAVLLVLVLGGSLLAGVPPAFGLAAFAASAGLLALARWMLPGGGVAGWCVALFALALGFDHALAGVRRYREAYATGYRAVSAASVAAATAGRSAVVCAGAQMLTAAVLFAAGGPGGRAAAAGAGLVAAVAAVTSATALPAALVLTQRTTGRPPGRWLRRTTGPARGVRTWRLLLSPAVRHPVAAPLAVAAVLAAMAAPVLHPVPWAARGAAGGVRVAELALVVLALLAGAAVALRSPRLALGVVLFDLLTAAAAWGVLGAPAGPGGGAPVAVLLVLSGLTLHQHVVAVGRVREGLRAGMRVPEAVADGFSRSVPAVTAGAAFAVAAGCAAVLHGGLPSGAGRTALVLALALALNAVAVRLWGLPALVARWASRPARPASWPEPAPRSADGQPPVSAIEDSGRQVEAVKGQ